MSKAAKWALTTGLTFLAFFVVIGLFLYHQTMDFARGNSYVMEHLAQEMIWDLRQNLRFSMLGTIFVGQPVYWIAYAIGRKLEQKENVYMKDMNAKRRRIWVVVLPVVSVIAAILLLIVTLPLWFHL
jgi:hypothetical protein